MYQNCKLNSISPQYLNNIISIFNLSDINDFIKLRLKEHIPYLCEVVLLVKKQKKNRTFGKSRSQWFLFRPQSGGAPCSEFASCGFLLVFLQKGDGEESVASWELRVEGRLLEDVS